ncbi:unnamed protein product [Danaus chrysippus]|uniref:(African queen) hypothetical protein n=1 Tax=Danaus chrysippus TaxID=151541 RepID=A0A8J2W206_9NEOP|nr:unnamed protein product [Danaus chrysippus]
MQRTLYWFIYTFNLRLLMPDRPLEDSQGLLCGHLHYGNAPIWELTWQLPVYKHLEEARATAVKPRVIVYPGISDKAREAGDVRHTSDRRWNMHHLQQHTNILQRHKF